MTSLLAAFTGRTLVATIMVAYAYIKAKSSKVGTLEPSLNQEALSESHLCLISQSLS